jgi:GTPase
VHLFVLPAADGQRIAWLHANGDVLADQASGEDKRGPLRRIEVRLDAPALGRFSRL